MTTATMPPQSNNIDARRPGKLPARAKNINDPTKSINDPTVTVVERNISLLIASSLQFKHT